MEHPDLEVSLFRQDAGVYAVDLRLADPGSEADRRLSSTAPIRFDFDALRKASQDPAAYGALLAGTLLAEEAVRSFFGEALAAAQANDAPLAVRLAINPNAVELHSLRWETLHLPNSSAPLLTGENLRFSRYLSSLDWRPVRLRSQADLRALVAVASPSNAAKWQLAEVKTEDELAAARTGLGSITITELATRGQVTLNNLAAAVRDGCDILYLVAHGILVDGEPQMLLEQEDGTGQWTAGRALVTRIYELQERPRLVVLVSCQSAGTGGEPTTQDDCALAGLGPRLAEAGVPAVIAMQGNLTMKTAADFMPVFFAELQRDSQVDRAMAVARGAVRDRPDWWMPVLYMHLRNGRIGYTPGFGDEKDGLRKWPALVRNIQAGRRAFLAYSRNDAAFMRRLRADLLAEGIDAWVDDQDLEPGTPLWQQAIQRAIREAQCMIALLSPDAWESERVNSEISLAKKQDLRIFPVLLRGDEDTAVPLALESVQYVDAREDYEGAVKCRLLPAVKKHLGVFAPKISTTPPLDIEWITIPAGEFLMGGDKAKDPVASDDEMPQHRLCLPEYHISRYPITNAQYARFVEETNRKRPQHWSNEAIPRGKGDHPVVYVSWYDASAYCGWARQTTKRLIRLPSEAEWEKAARGTDGRIYPWGNKPPTKTLCNFNARSNARAGNTTAIGSCSLGVSPYGVLDMAGNVWEWTSSLYKPYPYKADDGRENQECTSERVLRGGSYFSSKSNVRGSVRLKNDPSSEYWYHGFRVVLSPSMSLH